MKTLVIYTTLLEGSRYWRKFNNLEDARQFIKKIQSANYIESYELYQLPKKSDEDKSISEIELVKSIPSNSSIDADADKEIHLIKNPPKKPASLKNKDESSDKKVKFSEPELPPNKFRDDEMKNLLAKKEFPFEAGAHREGKRKLKNGKEYGFSEEYGMIDELETRKTDRYEIDYSFNKNQSFKPTFAVSVSNKEAINKAMRVINTNPAVSIRVYNLDEKGIKTNLLYSYDFKGIQ